MNKIELDRSLRKLRMSGMAETLETRVVQAQAESMPPLDFLSALVGDELVRRHDRLIARRIKKAGFRDHGRSLDGFNFQFNKKMDRKLVFELATGRFITQREDALFLGPPGTGKSHLAQAIGLAAIHAGHQVVYMETHQLLEDLVDANLEGLRSERMKELTAVPLLIIDDLGHGSTLERLAAIEDTVKEIKEKIRNGIPLVPEMKEF